MGGAWSGATRAALERRERRGFRAETATAKRNLMFKFKLNTVRLGTETTIWTPSLMLPPQHIVGFAA